MITMLILDFITTKLKVRDVHGITGSAHARIIHCLKSVKPQAGFDQYMTKFEELADTPNQGNPANSTASQDVDHEDEGRLSTIYEESETDLEAHILETWYTELREEKQLLETIPTESLYTILVQMVPDNCVLVAVADEQQVTLPMRGNSQTSDTEETFHVPLCSTDNDTSYGLDFDENGHYVELCFTAEM